MTEQYQRNNINNPRGSRNVDGGSILTLDDDLIVVDSSLTPVAVELPNAVQIPGNTVYIKAPQAGTNSVTVTGLDGQTIDGLASLVLSADEELHSSIVSIVEFFHSISLESELLDETERLLGQLAGHIEVLQDEDSLGLLEIELRKTDKTLSKLRINLLAYPEPDPQLIIEIDEAQAEVRKNLSRVKRGRKTLKALPFFVLGGAVIYAISRRR